MADEKGVFTKFIQDVLCEHLRMESEIDNDGDANVKIYFADHIITETWIDFGEQLRNREFFDS